MTSSSSEEAPRETFECVGRFHAGEFAQGVDYTGHYLRECELEDAGRQQVGQPVDVGHDASTTVGRVTGWELDPATKDLYARLSIDVSTARGRRVADMIERGELPALSMTNEVTSVVTNPAYPKEFDVVRMRAKGISLVERPDVPRSNITQFKRTSHVGNRRTTTETVIVGAGDHHTPLTPPPPTAIRDGDAPMTTTTTSSSPSETTATTTTASAGDGATTTTNHITTPDTHATSSATTSVPSSATTSVPSSSSSNNELAQLRQQLEELTQRQALADEVARKAGASDAKTLLEIAARQAVEKERAERAAMAAELDTYKEMMRTQASSRFVDDQFRTEIANGRIDDIQQKLGDPSVKSLSMDEVRMLLNTAKVGAGIATETTRRLADVENEIVGFRKREAEYQEGLAAKRAREEAAASAATLTAGHPRASTSTSASVAYPGSFAEAFTLGHINQTRPTASVSSTSTSAAIVPMSASTTTTMTTPSAAVVPASTSSARGTTTGTFGLTHSLMDIATTQRVGAGEAKSAIGELAFEHRARDQRIVDANGRVPIYTTQTVGAGTIARMNRTELGMTPKAMTAYDTFVRKYVGDYISRPTRNMSPMAHPGMDYIRLSGMLDYAPELVDVMRAPGPMLANFFHPQSETKIDWARGRYVEPLGGGDDVGGAAGAGAMSRV